MKIALVPRTHTQPHLNRGRTALPSSSAPYFQPIARVRQLRHDRRRVGVDELDVLAWDHGTSRQAAPHSVAARRRRTLQITGNNTQARDPDMHIHPHM